MHFLNPHEMFHHLYDQHKRVFNKLFIGNVDGDTEHLATFWKESIARRDPRLQRHEMFARVGWEKKAIPISIHGDGVACIRTNRAGARTLDVYSWQGMLGQSALCF